MGGAPRAILCDIEGTTTPIAYVRDVLFPFARARLPDLLRLHADNPEVAAPLAAVAHLAPDQPALKALLDWMDEDAKVTPLKTLQGLIWHQGYLAGELHGALYGDVAPALRRWHERGMQIEIYSSGSVEAQRLLFAHSIEGDLSPMISGFHDTVIGPKRMPESYRAIAALSGRTVEAWLFLSDTQAELDAALACGMQTCQLVRAADGTRPSSRHRNAADFNEVEAIWQAG